MQMWYTSKLLLGRFRFINITRTGWIRIHSHSTRKYSIKIFWQCNYVKYSVFIHYVRNDIDVDVDGDGNSLDTNYWNSGYATDYPNDNKVCTSFWWWCPVIVTVKRKNLILENCMNFQIWIQIICAIDRDEFDKFTDTILYTNLEYILVFVETCYTVWNTELCFLNFEF